jgi:hypothetical protein
MAATLYRICGKIAAGKTSLARRLAVEHAAVLISEDEWLVRLEAQIETFAAVLAGANNLAPWRFFVFNALGGIVWATVFGLGGYLLGAGIHRIAGPVGWAMLILALAAVLVLWRYFKQHEEALLLKAEREKANYERR